MESCELERRFRVAIDQWRCESEGSGPVITFSHRRMFAESLERSLERAMARCFSVPLLCVVLKDEFCFDRSAYDTVLYRPRVLEAKYIGVFGDDLIVAVEVWSHNTLEIVLRAIPLHTIFEIGVCYEEDAGRRRAA